MASGRCKSPLNIKVFIPDHTPLLLLLLSRFSRVQLCEAPQTAAHQAPPSLGFSRQEHQSGLPFPSIHTPLGRAYVQNSQEHLGSFCFTRVHKSFLKTEEGFPTLTIEETQKDMLFILFLHLFMKLGNFCSACKFYLCIISHGANQKKLFRVHWTGIPNSYLRADMQVVLNNVVTLFGLFLKLSQALDTLTFEDPVPYCQASVCSSVFVSSQQSFGVTDIKAPLGVSQLSGLGQTKH